MRALAWAGRSERGGAGSAWGHGLGVGSALAEGRRRAEKTSEEREQACEFGLPENFRLSFSGFEN